MNESERSRPPVVPLVDTSAAVAKRDRRRQLLALAGIGAIALGSASAFAWTAGWLGGDRLTAQRIVGAMEANGPAQPGFRRNHAKGVCVSGTFLGSAEGRALSSARRMVNKRNTCLPRSSERVLSAFARGAPPSGWRVPALFERAAKPLDSCAHTAQGCRRFTRVHV